MLNRFIQAKKDAAAPEKERRPWKASDVSEVPIAEKWRNSVIREIAKGVADIQNATLGEHAIRELNDQINKLIREKKHWETQVSAMDSRGERSARKQAPRGWMCAAPVDRQRPILAQPPLQPVQP
jgi:pre-mRNA-splicing factor ISY1